MEKNNDKSIFTKIWLGCFALLLTISAYGMFGQVKDTYSATKLYGIYMWRMDKTLSFNTEEYLVDFGTVPYDKFPFSINYAAFNGVWNGIKFSGDNIYYSYKNENGKIKSEKILSNSYLPQYCVNTDPYDGTIGKEYELCGFNASTPSSMFNDSNTQFIMMNFGNGATVTGDEYGCPGVWPWEWGKKCNYDVNNLINTLKTYAYKVNACYSNSSGMYWGHGSSYPGSTYVSLFDNKTECEKGVKVTFDSGRTHKYAYLRENSGYTYINDEEINHSRWNEVVVYLPLGTYDLSKLIEVSADDSYIFSGWYTEPDGGGTKITELVIDGTKKEYSLVADYDEAIKVTLNANGGTLNSNTTLYADKNGVISTAPKDPTNGSFPFAGWYFLEYSRHKYVTFPLTVTEDITLYASWDGVDVLFYDGPDKSNPPPNNICKVSVPRGGKISNDACEPPKKEGYIFTGWVSWNGETFDFNTAINSSIGLYAVFQPECIVDFDTKTDELIDSRSLICGEKLNDIPENPTRTGYLFGGWYLNAEIFEFDAPINSNITLEAKWIPKEKYTITYDANGGSYAPVASTYSNTGQISWEYPRYLGHIFKGWSTTKGCSNGKVNYPRGYDGLKKMNLTLYACWEVEKADEKCSLRSNPETYDSNLAWLILLEIIAIGSLVSYFVMKKIRKNSNVS